MAKSKKSEFDTWFKANFPGEPGRSLRMYSDEKLRHAVYLGKLATCELQARAEQRTAYDMAQKAWTARGGAAAKKEKYEYIGRLFKHRKSKKKGPKNA